MATQKERALARKLRDAIKAINPNITISASGFSIKKSGQSASFKRYGQQIVEREDRAL